MKAIEEKELRLGNLILGIYYEEDEEGEEIEYTDICTVLAVNDGNHIADYSIYVDSESDTEIFSCFQGIPLTEEWLLKLEFKKDKVDETYYKDNFEIMLPNFFQYKTSLISDALVKYVHQLQNLYWCLCGKELEIDFIFNRTRTNN